VGVVRVSGARALSVVAPLVRSAVPLADFPSHLLRRVALVDPRGGERLDQALAVVMRAPHSYTGEDVVELSCHGSPPLLRLVTELLIAGGARAAAPGEFTQRAFLNGRLDLAQAEAVALLIGARSTRAVRLAARALAGDLSRRLRSLRDVLLDAVAALEVVLDFPEDEPGGETGSAAGAIAAAREEAARLAGAARRGRVADGGVTVALVGPPNAGKSSLFNALLGRERAIVSPVPGTTRDVIDARIEIGGVPVCLLDTAGLGAPRDFVDAEGIRRSRQAIDTSDALILVLDGTLPADAAALAETAGTGTDRLVVLTKSDLRRGPLPDWATARVSSKTGDGIDVLMKRLEAIVAARAAEGNGEDALLVSLRQSELLDALAAALETAARHLDAAPVEVVLLDLRAGLNHLAALLGEEVGDAVLDRIFSTFCIGK
jgi:tRNA modification GTPase